MQKVLLVTDGLFHPPLMARRALRQTLAELDGFSFQHVRSLEKLPGNLEDFAALVIYIHHKKLSEEALSQLDRYVSTGGGVLGIHTATASFKQQMAYFEILGGRFIGHGPIEPFEVTPVGGDELFAGIPAFTVTDELYLHDLQPGLTVHFTSPHDDQAIPVVWTHRYGAGRVCYVTPGHRTATIQHPTYQQVLQRALVWVCGT